MQMHMHMHCIYIDYMQVHARPPPTKNRGPQRLHGCQP